MNAKTIIEYWFSAFAYCVFQKLVYELRTFLHTIEYTEYSNI
jgi:hypothetical protein